MAAVASVVPAVLATPAAAAMLEARVAASTDDAEESSSGTVARTSDDLELVFDGGNQTVGMRWAGLAIPRGSIILAAYVQFGSKESQSESTCLSFRAQAADNAPSFTSASGNLSTRPLTLTRVAWAPVSWAVGETGGNQRTPDLSILIQEVVGRVGWASGNALVLLATGAGHRTAWSFDGSPAGAPLLHVEYAPPDRPTAVLSAGELAGLPLLVEADGSRSVAVVGSPITSYRFDFGDGTPATITTAPTAVAHHGYAAAGTYTVTLVVTDAAGRTSTATAGVTMTTPTTENRVAATADDAEQAANGSVNVTGGDLELVFDTSTQTVGIRWAQLAIPQRSTIRSAYVQFSASESQSEATLLMLSGQAADNAAAFAAVNGNLATRPRTAAASVWAPAPWTAGEAGSSQRTPELGAVIQEIVNRPGWASGNALALLITGSGHRTAWSYDGNAAAAPLLHVAFDLPGPATTSVEPGAIRGVTLGPVSPNPARDALTLRFTTAARGTVRLALHDLAGRRLETLVDGELDAGEHFRRLDLLGVPEGVYFCSLTTPGRTLCLKFVHVR
ncbi:MAG TPA: PKD domain-containing protein [Candidatus Eisenbacteria bacterium]